MPVSWGWRSLAPSRCRAAVLIVEADTTIGAATSSRNSEVVHAGICYPAGSLKADLCVRGREMLYRYMTDHAVPHQRIGTLIVATADGQRDDLERIRGRAEANGVDNLRRVDAGDLTPSLAIADHVTALLDAH